MVFIFFSLWIWNIWIGELVRFCFYLVYRGVIYKINILGKYLLTTEVIIMFESADLSSATATLTIALAVIVIDPPVLLL